MYDVQYAHEGHERSLSFESAQEITPINAFHLYGIELFENIANVEDWDVIIKSFG